jgi:biotin carboxyl carrier protein
MDLTNEDVADVLALLDSLPYDEFDLQTARFRLTLRRTPDGWTQSTQVLAEPSPPATTTNPPATTTNPPATTTSPPATTTMVHRGGDSDDDGPSSCLDADTDEADGTNGEIEGSGTVGGGLREIGAGRREATGESAVVGREVGREVGGESGEAGGAGEAGAADGGLVAVTAPLPGTFYRAPRPGAPPFVEVGSRVSADTVVGIVETMKLMNSVAAGVGGTIAEICLGNAEFASHGATLLRIRADP